MLAITDVGSNILDALVTGKEQNFELRPYNCSISRTGEGLCMAEKTGGHGFPVR
jgi:hypothetical protein